MTKCVALSLVLLTGCEGAASWDRTEIQAPNVPLAAGARWEQYCTFNGAHDLTEINQWLHDQGTRGWELVSVAGQRGTVYCFKARVADERPLLDGSALPR
jgi:hypothetical protein